MSVGSSKLQRVVGVPGAVLMGLGSILGTGVFVSLGLAAGVAGPGVVLAVVLAAIVAGCNGLSSAQLAACYPVSGGTYEYGYRELSPALGFTAGWMFLWAKSASAATAALGLAGYAATAAGSSLSATALSLAGAAVAVLLTVIVAGGIGRSNRVNSVMVSLTLLALAAFVAGAAPAAAAQGWKRFLPFPGAGVGDLLHATALMLVAYTGYGRIATLGEEIRDPRRSIPRAIIVTLLVSMQLYVVVVAVGVGAVGAPGLAEATLESAAPLEVISRRLGQPAVAALVALGALTALSGVLLNLLLGLSRVALAMARRGDLPRALSEVDRARSSPVRAAVAVGGMVALLAAAGSLKTNWSFSAFTVLIYYALTNLAALRLAPDQRLFPRWIAWLGLIGCLGLAFWVEREIYLAGLGLILVGLIWQRAARHLAAPRDRSGSG